MATRVYEIVYPIAARILEMKLGKFQIRKGWVSFPPILGRSKMTDINRAKLRTAIMAILTLQLVFKMNIVRQIFKINKKQNLSSEARATNMSAFSSEARALTLLLACLLSGGCILYLAQRLGSLLLAYLQ